MSGFYSVQVYTIALPSYLFMTYLLGQGSWIDLSLLADLARR
jgi:hypothetical protein